ncbi:cation:proton antiporter [Cobetia sp. Dlab-2-AX]|uniref:cation:proton antiporter domain-containing protein n=1 Tax=Cobetia sp. Dlab-2-AX TaxID=2954488 RepID=UPI0034254746
MNATAISGSHEPLWAASAGSGEVELGHMGLLFLEEAGGGILLGLALGALVYQLMRSIDQCQVEVMLSLALVLGGYALASALHGSGPIVMVLAGRIIGTMARDGAMSDNSGGGLHRSSVYRSTLCTSTARPPRGVA